MKKIYIKPSIECVEVFEDSLLNNGSVVTSGGGNVGNLGGGTGGGTLGDGGFIWGDSKGNNVWDEGND
jgi:hypothetical protein